MTTRIWKASYMTETLFPALVEAGYAVEDLNEFFKVKDPDTGEVFLKALPHTDDKLDYIVRYDAKLFDENVEREYPNGM